MKKIVLAVIVLSSLSLSIGWFLKPTFSPTQNEQVRFEKEYKLLCKRYTAKSNQYGTRELDNVFFFKAVVYYDMKIVKYCNKKS